MKKSFMTRVLATGLSLAMAFSLTAATNVTVASAASKPAMASKQFAVRVGGAAKSYKASAATQKSYRISKATVGNTDKATVKVNSSKKSIKVTPGSVSGSTVVKISFKNIKTKKTTSKKYRCVVKAAVVEKQAIVKVEVTGVKTVTLTMAKEVASVESPVAITVKKTTADRPCKATAEGKTITLAMDAKLTQGAYTVSIAGMEDTALTADFNVEKDETLTSFEVSDYIVAKDATTTTIGSIKFAALNQYGEKMVANDPTVTCSFGKVGEVDSISQKPTKSATATAQGVITVWDINSVLAIPGIKGTVVLVGDMGVTTTKEITYNTFAKATKGEVVGTYNVNSADLKSIKEGDKIEDYVLLMKFTNQYDEVMSADELKGTLTVTITGGLTGIQVNKTDATLDTKTYKGEDYIAVPLAPAGAKAVAGDATLIVTNKYHGMLINDKITVAKNIVIKSMTITADKGLYEAQDNELSYEFIDADGNAVTSYADLVGCELHFGSAVRMERAEDGKAKLVYDGKYFSVPANDTTDKSSTPVTITATANKTTGGDYLVKTFQLTGYQKRYVKGVTGIKDDVTTSISETAAADKKNITIKSKDLVLADQYSNKVTDDEKIFNKYLQKGKISGTTTGTSVYVATNGAFEYDVVDNNKIVATPCAVGTATVYLKYKYDDKSGAKDVEATSSNYDAKFTLTAYDTKGVDVSTLVIDSIKDGCDVTTKAAADMTTADVVVKAVVGGVKTVIPTSQYIILDKGDKDFSQEDYLKGVKSKKATLKVQVTTWDSANTPIETVITKEYTVSRERSKLFKVTDATDVSISGNSIGTELKNTNFEKQFNFKDQYGYGEKTPDDLDSDTSKLVLPDGATGVDRGSASYTIAMVEAKDAGLVNGVMTVLTNSKTTGYKITSNGTNSANIKFTENGYYVFKVTVKAANGSTKTAKFTVSVGL